MPTIDISKILIEDTKNTLLIVRKIAHDLPDMNPKERFLYTDLLDTYKKEYSPEIPPTPLYNKLPKKTQKILDGLKKELCDILYEIEY